MFAKLKEKLKNWTKKLSEKAEPVETKEIVETKEKKVKHKEKEEVKPIEEHEYKEPKKREVDKGERELGEKIWEDIKEEDKHEREEKEKEKKKKEKKRRKEERKEEKAKEKEEEKPVSKSFFQRIKAKITKVKISEKEFDVFKEELENLLLENNVAYEVTERIIEKLKSKLIDQELLKKEVEEEVKDTFKEIIKEILIEPFDIVDKIKEKANDQAKQPFVILFCGVNGTGKTTTIAKITAYLKKKKFSCILAAADTFRAASIEQIKKHGERLNVPVISSQYGADPASVGFDAINYAKKNFIDVVLIDTAGRMHTAKNLMNEIEKISRVCKPDLKLFIGESITGNDSIEQVKAFDWAVGIDGIILTKADVDEKGGTALSLGYITKKPILFLGTGQEYEAITVFNKDKFIKELGL
jgi:fused signal recognition particle receptor